MLLNNELKRMLKSISDKQLTQGAYDYINLILYRLLEVLTEKCSESFTRSNYIPILKKIISGKLGSYAKEYCSEFLNRKIERFIGGAKIRRIAKEQNFKYGQNEYGEDLYFIEAVMQFIAMEILKLGIDESDKRGKKRIERYSLIREIETNDKQLKNFIEGLFGLTLDDIAELNTR